MINSTLRIAWIAIRELLYEKVFYLFFSFAIAALIFSLMLGQMTYVEQSKLTLDFMLAGTQISMVLFAIFMGISLFQREITLGSVAMVLSKPVARLSFVLGKYLGQLVIQCIVILSMAVITVLLCKSAESNLSYQAIIQSTMLTVCEIAVVSAFTYFFAVNAGAITAAIGSFILFMVGHFSDTVSQTLKNASGVQSVAWTAIKAALPNLEIFNMKTMASYGFAVSWNEIGIAAMYALCCIVMYLLLAILSFNQKDLFT